MVLWLVSFGTSSGVQNWTGLRSCDRQCLNQRNIRFESPIVPLISAIPQSVFSLFSTVLNNTDIMVLQIPCRVCSPSQISSHHCLLYPPEKLRQYLPVHGICVLVCSAHLSQGSWQRWRWLESNEWETGGEHLALWDHTSNIWFKISVSDRQLKDTWQFYHRIVEHTVISMLTWHMCLHFTGVCPSPHVSATSIWMQWLESQSRLALILSQPYSITLETQ